MNFKSKFKLEFEIETNSENMPEVLEIIRNNIEKELNEKIKDKTEIMCSAKIEKIEVNKYVDPKTRAETIGHNRQTRLENNRSESRCKQGRRGSDDADNIKSAQSRTGNLCLCGRDKGDNAAGSGKG